MVDKFIIGILIFIGAILVVIDALLTVKQVKMEKRIDELTERQEIKNKKMDDTEAKLNELMVGQSKYREQIKMAIMVEMAKLGFHPTDYIAKHAKKDENGE